MPSEQGEKVWLPSLGIKPWETGQKLPKADLGSPSSITDEDREWARELGATTEAEIVDLIREHEKSLS